MGRSGLGNVALNVTLVVCGVVMLVLAYGFVSRAFVPQEAPSVRADDPALRGGEEGVAVLGEFEGSPIQVEVRNAAGVNDLARVTTHYLREHGFDVIAVGNAPERDQTAIIILNGTTDYAMRVATALDISPNRIEEGSRKEYDPDVAVHIGNDYLTLTPFVEDTPPDSTH